MPYEKRQIRFPAVFGATGSLGRCVCGILAENGFGCAHLGGWNSHDTLAGLIRRLSPLTVSFLGAPSPDLALAIRQTGTRRVTTATEALIDADGAVVVSSGPDGSGPMLEAVARGMPVAAGNKETLVAYGQMIFSSWVGNRPPDVRPVDSEHAAASHLIEAMPGGAEGKRLIITGTGGAVRDVLPRLRAELSPSRVLRHPVWKMGAKITVDSATLVNKALEIVEASILFRIPGDRISVLFDPDARIHAAIESDGDVAAFSGPANMAGPVRMALGMPGLAGASILVGDDARMAIGSLAVPDPFSKRAMDLGHTVLARGGCSPMVLVIADEAAVRSFLAGRMRFGDIVPFIEDTLDRFRHAADMNPESAAELSRLRKDLEGYTSRI